MKFIKRKCSLEHIKHSKAASKLHWRDLKTQPSISVGVKSALSRQENSERFSKMVLEQDEFENTDFSFLCGGKTCSISSDVVSRRPLKQCIIEVKFSSHTQ